MKINPGTVNKVINAKAAAARFFQRIPLLEHLRSDFDNMSGRRGKARGEETVHKALRRGVPPALPLQRETPDSPPNNTVKTTPGASLLAYLPNQHQTSNGALPRLT